MVIMLRDDPVIEVFDSPDAPPNWIEWIDIENGEYQFCKIKGHHHFQLSIPVRLSDFVFHEADRDCWQYYLFQNLDYQKFRPGIKLPRKIRLVGCWRSGSQGSRSGRTSLDCGSQQQALWKSLYPT